MSTNLDTRLNYDFSHYNFSNDEKMRIIRKNEKIVKDHFMGDLDITLTSDSNGDIWYKMGFYLHEKFVEFHYSDKNLYLTMDGYEILKYTYNTNDMPFYNHPVKMILEWLYKSNSEYNEKMSLISAIEFIIMIYNVLNTMVNNYSQWVNG